MVSTSRSRPESRSVTMVSLGSKLRLMSLLSLLFWGMVITPAASFPTAAPAAEHESILHALRFHGLTAFADALDSIIWNQGLQVPENATLFVPVNGAMAPVAASLKVSELTELLSYHIVTENLPVMNLVELPVGTELKTLAANKSLEVTENTRTALTINHQKVMRQDLCTISTVACYAVKEVLMLERSSRVLLAAPGEGPILSPAGLPLPPMNSPMGVPLPSTDAPMMPPMASPMRAPLPPTNAPVESPMEAPLPPVNAPMESPMASPMEAPLSPVNAPMRSPMASPMGAPLSPTNAPMVSPVMPPSEAPTVFPPTESPVSVPVPAGAPAVIVLPPGSPSASYPGEAPLPTPGADPEGASSAATATTVTMATVLVAGVLPIFFL